MAAELKSDAYLKHHVRVRRSRGEIIQAPAPWIPPAERVSADVPLPVPLCRQCREPIYYEQRAWHHRDTERNHEAVAFESAARPLTEEERKQRIADRNRRARLAKKVLDSKPGPMRG